MPDQSEISRPSATDDLPSWYAPLATRAFDATLGDDDLRQCLQYLLKLRSERDRLFHDLAHARTANQPASLPTLDRFEAVLAYVSAALADAPLEAVPYLQGVAARLNGRAS